MSGYVLLVETPDEWVAVAFPTVEAARAWEDDHEEDLPGIVRGVARLVTRQEVTA